MLTQGITFPREAGRRKSPRNLFGAKKVFGVSRQIIPFEKERGNVNVNGSPSATGHTDLCVRRAVAEMVGEVVV